MIRRYDGLRPAIGFDPESVWKNAAPHTYVYQVSRGRIEVPAGTYGGRTVYDVRQVGFLFSKVEERTWTDTAYISKAEVLMPYFALCFGEEAVQRATTPPDRETYPLVRAITDKGLEPANYVGYKEYHALYKSRVKLPKPGKHYHAAYVAIMNIYEAMITLEHREFLKQYDLFAAA